MSVVGLTFGMAANASRPTTASAASAATSDRTRAGGRSCSYQRKPATSTRPSTSNEDNCQLTAREVARVGLFAAGQPGRCQPRRAGLVLGALVDQVVARVLQEQGDFALGLDPSASGPRQPLRQPQQRALAGAVAPHQRRALP